MMENLTAWCPMDEHFPEPVGVTFVPAVPVPRRHTARVDALIEQARHERVIGDQRTLRQRWQDWRQGR